MIASGTSRYRSRGGLEVVPGGYRATRGGSRLVDHHRQETPAALAAVRDGSLHRAHLLWAAAFLLLEAIAGDAPGDPDASAPALERGLGLAEPDRVLLPALIRVALALFERRAGHDATQATVVSEVAGLLGEVKRSAPPSAEPPWPGEPLTRSETRVLRHLPAETRQLLESWTSRILSSQPGCRRSPAGEMTDEARVDGRAVLVHEREEKPPAVRQNQVLLSERPMVARSREPVTPRLGAATGHLHCALPDARAVGLLHAALGTAPARDPELIPGFPDARRRCPRPVELACDDTAIRYWTAPPPHTTNRPGAVTLRIPETARPRPGWR